MSGRFSDFPAFVAVRNMPNNFVIGSGSTRWGSCFGIVAAGGAGLNRGKFKSASEWVISGFEICFGFQPGGTLPSLPGVGQSMTGLAAEPFPSVGLRISAGSNNTGLGAPGLGLVKIPGLWLPEVSAITWLADSNFGGLVPPVHRRGGPGLNPWL